MLACTYSRELAQFYKEACVHGLFTRVHDLVSSVHASTEIMLRAYSQALLQACIIMLDESSNHNPHNCHKPLL